MLDLAFWCQLSSLFGWGASASQATSVGPAEPRQYIARLAHALARRIRDAHPKIPHTQQR
jgi:hypothetical protein